MPKVLFTSNSSAAAPFRWFGPAAAGTVIAICVIEAVLSFALPPRFVNHEVDVILRDLDHKKYDAEFLLLGDSVGRQITGASIKPDDAHKVFANLASNAAIEMTGQYYLTMRYLRTNRNPRAIIFTGRNPLGGDLNQVYTENFVQRCFLRWDEIAGIASKKGAVFGLVMTVYRLLPSYRYRLHLQKLIAGFTNADIGTGIPIAAPTAAGSDASHGWSIFKSAVWRLGSHPTPASDFYLDRLLAECDRRSIDFYLFAAPIPDPASPFPANIPSYTQTRDRWDALAAKHPSFHLVTDQEFFPSEAFRDDHIHLRPAAVLRAGRGWWASFYKVLKRSNLRPAA